MLKLEAYFPQEVAEIRLNSLTQWDKDVLLHISGDDLPEAFEIHIGYEGIFEAFRFPLQKVDGVATIKIPNELLQQTRNVVAWVYVIDSEGCKTTKTIIIPLEKREKPVDYETAIEPSQKANIEQLLEKVNELIKHFEEGESSTLQSTISSVKLFADQWAGESSPYSQVVNILGATKNSKIDLNPTVEQLDIFHSKDITFVVENDDGIITVFCIGQKPTNDYAMQATLTEVNING